MLAKFLIPLSIVLMSCTVGPDYERPVTAVTDSRQFINQPAATEGLQLEWWKQFDDPILSAWIEELLRDNNTLKSAAERVVQAREAIIVEQGALFPSLGLESGASRQRTGSGSFGALGEEIPGTGTQAFYNNNFNLRLASSWQVDLFGKIRQSVSSREAIFLATQADKKALEQSLVSELIRRRIEIANLKRQQQLSEEIIASRKQTLDSVNRRYQFGTASVSALDLRLAEENYYTAKASLPAIDSRIVNALYSVDVLLGNPPGTLATENQDYPLLPAPEKIHIPQPITLLDQRPDLMSSELRLVAANEDIGIAIADLYPSIVITGNYGYQSLDIDDLIRTDQIVWQIASSITARLFEGGRLRANIRLSEARARELIADYVDRVLNALKEVEVALVTEKNLQTELEHNQRSTRQVREAEVMAQDRYSKGLLSLIDLLDTQRRRALIEQNLLQTELKLWNSRVDLYLALGGEWEFGDDHVIY